MLVRPNLWLLPANIDLVGAESELVSVVGRETILREALAGLDDKFDYIFIDCAPSLGLLTLNALAAVDEILIPLQPHFLALQGLGKLLQTVSLVNKRINPALKVKWVLLCMFEAGRRCPMRSRPTSKNFLLPPATQIAPGRRRRFCPSVSAEISRWPKRRATAKPFSNTTPPATAQRTTKKSPNSSITKCRAQKQNFSATENTEVTEVVKKAPIEIVEIPSAQPAQTPTANVEIKENQI